MNKILFFTRHSPDPDGGGGSHRTYQVYHELISTFGEEAVDFPVLRREIDRNNKLKSYYRAMQKRCSTLKPILQRGFFTKKLFNQIIDDNQSGYNLFKQVSLCLYEDYLKMHGAPSLCIVDDPRFLPIIKFNKDNKIPTIYCSHNIDSLDLCAHHLDQPKYCKLCGTSLIYELESITYSKQCMTISKFEADIFKGLGVDVIFYPYLPVGIIKQRLNNVRLKRMTKRIDPSLFLLIGSVNHTSTYNSFKWFLTKRQQYGLPSDTKIVVGGRSSDKLGEEFSHIQGVEFLGWIEQDLLEEYLIQSCAVLIPQMSGFGSVTRISEMAYAGIPMIVSKHALHSQSSPPGIMAVGDDWSEWAHAMDSVRNCNLSNSINDYEVWEAKQPKPLIETVRLCNY